MRIRVLQSQRLHFFVSTNAISVIRVGGIGELCERAGTIKWQDRRQRVYESVRVGNRRRADSYIARVTRAVSAFLTTKRALIVSSIERRRCLARACVRDAKN